MNIVRIAGLMLVAMTSIATGEEHPYKPAANAEEALQRIEELGARVRYLSRDEGAVEVDFRHAEVYITDDHLRYMRHFDEVAAVMLSATQITDAGLEHLREIKTLKRLHLGGTKVTDGGMKHLSECKNLEYLIMQGCEGITDAGLAPLNDMKHLSFVCLAGTNVSENGKAKLRKAVPNCNVVPNSTVRQKKNETAWEISKAALKHAEKELEIAKREEKELAPRAEQLKQEYESLKKQSEESRKRSDDARKKADEARKRADDAERKSRDSANRAKSQPDNADLAKQAESLLKVAEELRGKYADEQKRYEAIKAASDKLRNQTEETRQTWQKAANAKKVRETAEIVLQAAIESEAYARAKVDEISDQQR